MIDFISKDRYCFEDLVRLVHLLRAPGGCPWDGAQTHESIRRNFLEEAYEVCVCKKLVFRHPFLFGGENPGWDELKKREKGQQTATETLDAVARSLPACWRAEKLQKKAAKTGFAWESAQGSLDKLEEETSELRAAVASQQNVEEELGDVLFAAVNAAACLEIDPEMALHAACEKFIRRFGAMEQAARSRGARLDELTRHELLQLWNEQKSAR